ncbi:type II secretion system protein [Viridibacillus arvi]|uniref:type II secretion system protein n=1 Tax=Viridibacillus arvi TaxID=263475 RepID=UPI003D078454
MNTTNNEKGITLVETLAVIVITALIAILIFKLQLTSSEQYKRQVNQNQQLNEISYVLKVITKEMRKTTDINSTEDGIGIKIKNAEYKFDENTKTINKNDEPFAINIKEFKVTYEENGWVIIIENLEEKIVTTKIVVRGGN